MQLHREKEFLSWAKLIQKATDPMREKERMERLSSLQLRQWYREWIPQQQREQENTVWLADFIRLLQKAIREAQTALIPVESTHGQILGSVADLKTASAALEADVDDSFLSRADNWEILAQRLEHLHMVFKDDGVNCPDMQRVFRMFVVYHYSVAKHIVSDFRYSTNGEYPKLMRQYL